MDTPAAGLLPGTTERFVTTNGVRLHVVEAGPAAGPLVVLLHGFPELWYGWRGQIPALAEAGFRVLVPDQRGYNTSDKPVGVAAYRVESLARDVAGLVESTGREKALVVGHDWGAVVAWWLAPRGAGAGRAPRHPQRAPPRGHALHVHSAESMDAALPLEQQLVAFAAHGGEVVVTTEHDRVVDARPLIAQLGLADRIVGVVGAEVTGTFHGGETPLTIGHLNASPLVRVRTAYRGGAPSSEGVRVRGVIREVRAGSGDPFVQINHPRESGPDDVGDGSFFSHLGVAGKPLDPSARSTRSATSRLPKRDPVAFATSTSRGSRC